MDILKSLNKRFGNYAIPGLIFYIVMLSAFVYIANLIAPTYIDLLQLEPDKILQGQVWRLVTFVLIPPKMNPLFLFFFLYLFFLYGSGLEREWGVFKFNCYYFLGMILQIIAAFICGTGETSFVILNLIVFLAFARIYPDFTLYIMFLLPVKVKYIGWLIWAYFFIVIVQEPWPVRILHIAGVLNYLIFFGTSLFQVAKNKSMSMAAKQRLSKTQPAQDKPFHCCAECEINEQDDPEMDFRVCDECENGEEYCEDHIENHDHR